MGKTRIILGSNREVWWDGLALLLKQSQHFEIIATCYDAREITEKTDTLHPDIVLLDIDIKGGSSAVTRRIGELHPEIKVILVIKPYKDITFPESLKTKAKAYIDKNITYPEIENCIRYVTSADSVVIYSFAAQRLLEHGAGDEAETSAGAENNFGLSRREKEVLYLLADKGATNREIAEALHITEYTVKAHLSSIFEKMHVRNRQQALVKARENNLLSTLQ